MLNRTTKANEADELADELTDPGPDGADYEALTLADVGEDDWETPAGEG